MLSLVADRWLKKSKIGELRLIKLTWHKLYSSISVESSEWNKQRLGDEKDG